MPSYCSYNDQVVNGTRTAAAPEYFIWWLYLCIGPVFYILTFMQSLWESKISAFLVSELASALQ